MVKANHSRKKSIFFLFGAHNKSSIALGHEWHFIIRFNSCFQNDIGYQNLSLITWLLHKVFRVSYHVMQFTKTIYKEKLETWNLHDKPYSWFWIRTKQHCSLQVINMSHNVSYYINTLLVLPFWLSLSLKLRIT